MLDRADCAGCHPLRCAVWRQSHTAAAPAERCGLFDLDRGDGGCLTAVPARGVRRRALYSAVLFAVSIALWALSAATSSFV
ncbi:MAG: hypothetical protein R2912_05280 [Eubacteriales bacterium]